ncbi:MAG TPA: ABC transporter substrate-binding protein [Lautropia sp.]|jgi:peptide/nickel transport system substrate-binding protein|nr:ABC transporter substrate-binding protein [Lautropia sp.]
MNRPSLAVLQVVSAALLCAAFGLVSPPAAAQAKTLRIVAHADVKILDPGFTTAYITRNFGYMVYDMLFGLDGKGEPRPQMVDKYTTSDDGKAWTFSLRPGLAFSDGSPVTAADAVASIQRWASRDSVGRAMTAAGAEWKVTDAASFAMTLKEPFGLVLQGLAKPSGFPPVIMPERLAKLPTASPLNEVLGSGPFLFKRDEWVPGNKVVFVRNPAYVPRSEPADGLAGSKKPNFDRVEWLYLPDSNSAVAALKNREVDMIEQLPPDFIAPLRADPDIHVGASGAYQGFMVMNHLHAPFNNPKVRQALLVAVSQERFVAGMGYPPDMRISHCPTYFICGGANETQAGAEPFRKADVAKAKRMLSESGYKGEKVLLLVPTDVPYLNAEALVAAQTLRSIGFNVDTNNMDWASVGARRARKDAPDAGGWSMYLTVAGEFDVDSPITNAYLSASCGNSLPGWPCDKELDELRTAWLRETEPAKRREVLDAFQKRAFEAVPYISVGQYSAAFAARRELKHVDRLSRGLPTVWVLDK